MRIACEIDDNYELLCRLRSPLVGAEGGGLSTCITVSPVALKELRSIDIDIQCHVRLALTWQYFGTITCDGLHRIMKLYIDKP